MRRMGEETSFTKHMLKQNIRQVRYGVKQRKVSLAQGLVLVLKHIVSPNFRNLIVHRKFILFLN